MSKIMVDRFGRVVDYLRISVTERCNFRCTYCMPQKDFSWVPKENLMSYEELFEFARIAIDRGVNKIRITGGEPTLRDDLHYFISMIYNYKKDIDLAMTTNGFLMGSKALEFKNAGLKRVNISLDTLKEDIALKLAQKDVLKDVIKGIEKSIEVGLIVKLNTVVLKNINDKEIIDLLDYAKSKNIIIRFIEYMENESSCSTLKGVCSKDILNTISKKYNFKEDSFNKSSPAKYYLLNDGYRFGIIEPHQDEFCKNCNKIRLTAEGDIIPCLYFDEAVSIKDSIKQKNRDKTHKILDNMLDNKPEKNRWSNKGEISARKFFETGG